MKKIKIRVKMMLWYTLLTGVLLAVFLPVLYQAISSALFEQEKSNILGVMSLVESGIEFENGKVQISGKVNPSPDKMVAIWGTDGKLIYASSSDDWYYTLDLASVATRIRHGTEDWLYLDREVRDDSEVVKIRVCTSLEGMESAMHHTELLILLVIPLFFLITIGGGLFIAKRALHPVSHITKLARNIGQGDLSQRITDIESSDEVGELADTFNQMLDSLENSFEKEKRFSSDASHELRTPVAVIMANSEAILADQQDETTKEAIIAIITECQRMNRVISQLLMLTRGTEGKYQLRIEDVSLPVVIEAVLEQFQEEADNQSISLVYQPKDVTVRADQSLITQMMLNLVGNAIKYGRSDGHVWVKAEREGNGCRIIVSDDGIGIAAEDLTMIFDRFYRADKSRDRSGSGLGLSIVKYIVDAHKGQIEVKSEFGKKSAFSIYL